MGDHLGEGAHNGATTWHWGMRPYTSLPLHLGRPQSRRRFVISQPSGIETVGEDDGC